MKTAYLVAAVLLATTPSMADDWRSKELRNINNVEKSIDAAQKVMERTEQDCTVALWLADNHEWLAELINQKLCGRPSGIIDRLDFARQKLHEANVNDERLHSHAEPLPERVARRDRDFDPSSNHPELHSRWP